MASLIRIFENRVERKLESKRSKGVIPPASLAEVPGYAPDDDRALVPPLGLREYWYPALPEKKVGRKPLFWTMLGDEIVFFRDKAGEVAAISDVCPHRNASISEGACYYPGFVTCPYHGATFDGKGQCVAFLTEGPESKMVGELKARTYPTRVLGGWVFIWMGQGEPVPIEEDVPPELFDPEIVPLTSYTYWYTNWLLAIENHSDAHNAMFVHRNSINQLLFAGGRNRSPIGPRSKIVNNRALLAEYRDDYYAKNGTASYQMYYPGVEGVWPLHRWRLLWQWFFKGFVKRRTRWHARAPEEWQLGHHLPCIVRTGGNHTRYAVAVEPNFSRVVYFYFVRARTPLRRLWEKLHFALVHMPLQYNFSNQDNGAASPCRFWMPEYLSSTDVQIVQWRSLITQQSRDAIRRKAEQPVEGDRSLRRVG